MATSVIFMRKGLDAVQVMLALRRATIRAEEFVVLKQLIRTLTKTTVMLKTTVTWIEGTTVMQ